jgi:hypothetical protein
MIDVDDAPLPSALVEHEGCWAASADIGDVSVTIGARHVAISEMALQAVSPD